MTHLYFRLDSKVCSASRELQGGNAVSNRMSGQAGARLLTVFGIELHDGRIMDHEMVASLW